MPRRHIALALECMGNVAAFGAFNACIFGGAFKYVLALICQGWVDDNPKAT